MKGEEGGGMRGEGRGEGEKGRNGDSTVKMQINGAKYIYYANNMPTVKND